MVGQCGRVLSTAVIAAVEQGRGAAARRSGRGWRPWLVGGDAASAGKAGHWLCGIGNVDARFALRAHWRGGGSCLVAISMLVGQAVCAGELQLCGGARRAGVVKGGALTRRGRWCAEGEDGRGKLLGTEGHCRVLSLPEVGLQWVAGVAAPRGALRRAGRDLHDPGACTA